MKYIKSPLYQNQEVLKLISHFELILNEVELRCSYIPEAGLYQSSLVLCLEDSQKSAEIKIITKELSVVLKNHGNQYIGQDFSKDLVDILDELIYDHYHK